MSSKLSSLSHIRTLLVSRYSRIAAGTATHAHYIHPSSLPTIRPFHSSRALLSSQIRSTPSIPPSQAQTLESEEMSEPTGLIAKSGIELLTFGTPNGYKASILLEELKEAYGKEYTWQSVNIMKNTQKEPWFTAVGANGRIPAIIDHDCHDFPVFEGLAILGYLTRRYDPEHKFSFPVDSNEYDEAETWMAWQHGGLGPMQGQANHFARFAKEKIAYGIQRYVGETERLYGVLNTRLEGRDYLVGNKFSIADINLIGWVNGAEMLGLDLEKNFSNVEKWLNRCLERPAVKKGFAIPYEFPFTNAKVKEDRMNDPEKKQQFEEYAKLVQDAKDQYGYKYAPV
ncbi:glutathione S-transferase [Xylariaceae sp. FL0255]|nr:glutathione S-transferase [Xylariaceae sp. FL0255]